MAKFHMLHQGVYVIKSGEMTNAVMNPQHFGSDPAGIRIRMLINPGISNFGSLLVEVKRLALPEQSTV